MRKWYEEVSDEMSVIISSRVRLARNLRNYRFQNCLTDKDADLLVQEVRNLSGVLQEKEKQNYYSCNVNRLGELERASMVERYMISPLLAEKRQDTGLVLSEDEGISVMVNEEDHLRIQAVVSGQKMEKAFEAANRVDDLLEEKLEYAFDDKYGYLTTCPTNTGTGLRASYMVFLPALAMAGKIQRLSEEVGKYGVTIRGLYGEGTKSIGYIYQISNQKTLGSSEYEIIEGLNQMVRQTIKEELRRREYLMSSAADEIEDKVYRSYGVLRYAKKLNATDAMTLLAQLKLGVELGVVKPSEKVNLHLLMIEIQPANLQKIIGKGISAAERDGYRAAYVNKKLSHLL